MTANFSYPLNLYVPGQGPPGEQGEPGEPGPPGPQGPPGSGGGASSWKAYVQAVATTNQNTTGAIWDVTIDGVVTGDGYRVLLTAQTNPVNNGVYVVHNGAPWTRVTDADADPELRGLTVAVERGTLYAGTVWAFQAPIGGNTIILGTTPLPFVQVGGGGGLPTENAFAGRTLRRNPTTNVAEWTTNYGWMPYTAIAAGATPDWTQFSVDNLTAPTQFRIFSSTYDSSRYADLRSLQVGDVINLIHMTSTTFGHRLLVTGTPVYADFVLTVPVTLVPETATGWGAPPSIAVGGNYAVHLTYSGTATSWNSAWGVVAPNAAANGVIAASAVTLVTQAFTAVAGRRYALRVLNSASYTELTATGNTFRIEVQIDGTSIHNLNLSVDAVNNYFPPSSTIIDLEPTAGTHTITLVGIRVTGTGNMTARMALAIEDVGPVSQVVTTAPTPVMQWNSAWGIIASGPTAAARATAPNANTRLGADITFSTIAGRRYRIIRRINSLIPSAQNFGIALGFLKGAGVVGDGDQWMWSGGNYSGGIVQSDFLGDGTTWTVYSAVLSVNAGAGTYVDVNGAGIYVEDLGPVSGATPVPNPTPAWIAPTYQNSWHAFNASWSTPGYRLIGDKVELRGMVSGGTAPSVAFTLPVGYRPPKRSVFGTLGDFIGTDGTGRPGRVDIDIDGTVVIQSGPVPGTGWITLETFWFSVTP